MRNRPAFDLIRSAAQAGAPAPSNEAIGWACGAGGRGRGGWAVKTLVRDGAVAVEKCGSRRVFVLPSGERTAPTRKTAGPEPQHVAASLADRQALRTGSPREACDPIAVALAALAGRAARVGNRFRLDGREVGPREVVAAAVAVGARIWYPGVRPHPQARVSAPSLARSW